MHIGIAYGNDRLELEVPEQALVGVQRPALAPDLDDPASAVRQALEEPLGFPALRRALTPDDHVTLVVDEQLPHLPELLTAILEHVARAGVRPEAITLLCLPPSTGQPWVEELPEGFQEVRVEVHDPADRRHLSYLATTKHGRRIYLNRSAVDADQLVVLTRRGYDALLGYSGAAGALFPALSDEATRQESRQRLSMAAPGETAWPLRREADEVAWLLGAPFLVQVIEGAGSALAHVLGGLAETDEEGCRLLDARWRVEVDRPADVVIAGVSGEPGRHSFAELARAAACACRVVKAGGRIVLLSASEPALGEAVAVLRQAEDAGQALQAVHRQDRAADQEAAFQWASAIEQAHVYLLSHLSSDITEELFATPLEHAGQVQRLLGAGLSCVFLPDAHKGLAVVRNS
jgi:nickel-dependent lactate racemase